MKKGSISLFSEDVMIEFKPEPVADLRARYSLALKDSYNQVDVSRGLRVRPGNRPEHVFDFIDQIRLIISKEVEPNGRLVIHISGSVRDEDDNNLKLNDTYLHHIIEHFGLLSESDKELEFKMISNEVVAHFYLRLDN